MQNKVIINTREITSVIFDLDGTIVNNMPYQTKAWISFATKYDKNLTEEIFHKKYSGLRSDNILMDMFKKELTLEEIESYRKERGSMYKEIFEKEIQEVKGLTHLLQTFKNAGIRLALATTASKANRDFVLDRLNIRDYFEVIVGGEHVKNGKPNPEIYNLAISKIHATPKECIAFEDSLVGIESANRANINVIAVLTSHKKEDLPSHVIGAIINFTEVVVL